MILLYHGVVPDDSPPARTCVGQAITQSAFERQIEWLATHRSVVSLAQYMAGAGRTRSEVRQLMAITIDDGYGLTFDCVYPVLTRMNVTATIFAATGHLNGGELLWFSYLKALCFEGFYKVIAVDQHDYACQTLRERKRAWDGLRRSAVASGDPVCFCRTLATRYPLTPDIVSLYGGMTSGQLRMAADSTLFELGAHTITHPVLPRLSKEEQREEILGSRRVLSELTGKPTRYFAYPGGEYDHDTMDLVKAVGYEGALAVIPRELGVPSYEIGRVGVYSQSMIKFRLKTMGAADLGRRFGLRVG